MKTLLVILTSVFASVSSFASAPKSTGSDLHCFIEVNELAHNSDGYVISSFTYIVFEHLIGELNPSLEGKMSVRKVIDNLTAFSTPDEVSWSKSIVDRYAFLNPQVHAKYTQFQNSDSKNISVVVATTEGESRFAVAADFSKGTRGDFSIPLPDDKLEDGTLLKSRLSCNPNLFGRDITD